MAHTPPPPSSSSTTVTGARKYSVDSSLEDEVDSILLQDDDGGHLLRGASVTRGQPVTATAVVYFITLTVTTTCTAQLLPYVATHSRGVVFGLPFVLFASLSLLLGSFNAKVGSAAGRNTTARIMSVIMGNTAGEEDRQRRRLMIQAGGMSAASFLLSLVEARRLNAKIWQAINIFVLPALLLFLPLMATQSLSSNPRDPHPPYALALVCLATATIVGVELIGATAMPSGLAIALLRVPIEAARLLLLREGVNDASDLPSFAFGSACAATISAFPVLLFGVFFPQDAVIHGIRSIAGTTVLPFLAFASASHVILLLTLQHFTSPIYAAVTLLPRNIVLLLYATLGRGGVAIRSDSLQMLCALLGGTAGVFMADQDLSSAFSGALASVRSSGRSPNGNGWLGSPSAGGMAMISTPTVSKRLALLPFVTVLVSFIYTIEAPTSSLASACNYLPINVRSSICHTLTTPTSRTVDLVIAYYDEDTKNTRAHIQAVLGRPFVKRRQSRVLIYNKGPKEEKRLRKELELRAADEVIPLPNVGREGQTYLEHILLHYNASISALALAVTDLDLAPTHESVSQSRVLADHTIMLQPHMAWSGIADRRLDLAGPETGFLHLGPMMVNKCGMDTRVKTDMPLIRDLYNIFVGEVCPPQGLLSAWSAQFVVSKRRILANAYKRYAKVNELMTAPEGHWIHELWGANESNGPSNPAFGHHLERSWPAIMGCSDPSIAEACPDDVFDQSKCQCLDLA